MGATNDPRGGRLNEFSWTDKARPLMAALNSVAAKLAPPNFRWSSWQVNVDSVASVHTDKNNAGPSLFFLLGKFSGGVFEALEEGLVVDNSQVGQLFLIDGCKRHQSDKFEGQRCSFVAFYHTSVDSLSKPDKERLAEAGFRLSSPTVPRTRLAGAYTGELCRSWAAVVKGAYEQWPPHVVVEVLKAAVAGRSLAKEAAAQAKHGLRAGQLEEERRNAAQDAVTAATAATAAAAAYADFCLRGDDYEPSLVKKAAKLGDELLRSAGSIAEAARLVREERQRLLGNALGGILDMQVGQWLEPEHQRYLEEMATQGVPARRMFAGHRLEAKPHGSAVEHIAEMYRKAWGDSKHLAVLWCTSKSEEFFSRLIESPLGRAPNMLPDRTISSEGRPIHDMRIANEASPKDRHPQALQPSHRQLARLALWWQARHPGIPLKCAKRDVGRAFK